MIIGGRETDKQIADKENVLSSMENETELCVLTHLQVNVPWVQVIVSRE